MTLDEIIAQSIDRVIYEGYSGVHFEDQIDYAVIPKTVKWLQAIKSGIPNVAKSIYSSFYINLIPFIKNKNVFKDKNSTISVRVQINNIGNDYKIHKGIEAMTYINGNGFAIVVNINPIVDISILRDTLKHELTHSVDHLISNICNYKINRHQLNSFDAYSNIPYEIKFIMYCLWDTTEFNAWQTSYKYASGGFNEFIEQLMNYLRKANDNNDPNVWSELRYYLIEKSSLGSSGDRDFRRSPLQAVKKYFITTSFNKLKKYIKKVKM